MVFSFKSTGRREALNRKTAFITGITGQDGSYLAEFLLKKDYEVHGLIRRSSNFNTQRINHIYQDPHELDPRLFLHYGDLTDGVSLTNLVREIEPDEVYNLAAQSHVPASFTIPIYTSQVDAVGALGLLEAIRLADIDARFYQASTSEMFGSTLPPQNEFSAMRPRNPYAAAKLMAYWSVINYREGFNLHATNGILFNHESPRRGETFVTRKISKAVAEIATGSRKKLFLGNLNAIRDWGYAKEYVESMWLMLQKETPSDYVIATGVGATVADFAKVAFSRVNLNWENHVEIDEKYMRPTETDALIGDSSKARKELGWEPSVFWKDLAHLMVDADLQRIQNQLC
jgi:GDPmannose 4,6-dehydratase